MAAWTLLHFYLSWNRSVWQDEIMRFQQMQMSLPEALRSLFLEPSPFAPGEILLAFASKALFSLFTPFEFWARLPSVLWGALTLLWALRLGSPVLACLLALSVSVTTFCTQFRPYGALLFAGALAFDLVWDKRKLSRRENLFAWFTLFFTHLYGVLFIAAASALRKEWARAAAGLLYLAAMYAAYRHLHQGNAVVWADYTWVLDVREFTQHSLRALGNPYTISFVLLPLAACGWAVSLRGSPRPTLNVTALLIGAIAGPLLANRLGNYGFVPRQIVGAVFPYLFFVAKGAEWVGTRMGRRGAAAGFTVLMALMFRSWWLYVSDGRPPVAEQPLHRHKKLVQMSQAKGFRNVALIDPGGTGFFYFEQLYGPKHTESRIKAGQREIILRCWEGGFCLYHFDEPAFAWKDLNELGQDAAFMAFLNGTAPRFDAVLVNAYKFTVPVTAPLYRTW